jgi:hypothetical protein
MAIPRQLFRGADNGDADRRMGIHVKFARLQRFDSHRAHGSRISVGGKLGWKCDVRNIPSA